MKLYYYKDSIGNFGDDLNAVIWDKIWPNYSQYSKADWLVGIGSIFTGKLNQLSGIKLIMGSGYWPTVDGKPDLENCSIGFVRGPLSCRELGINNKFAITDTAVLIINQISNKVKSDDRIGFMPHCATHNVFDCAKIAEMAGFRYIDPTGPVQTVLDAIMGSKKIIVEAMHGAIVADAMGIPWQRISIFNRKLTPGSVVDFKWQDWGSTLELDTTPTIESLLPWPGHSPLRRLIKKPYIEWSLRGVAKALRTVSQKGKYKISNRKLFLSKIDQLNERIEIIKSEK